MSIKIALAGNPNCGKTTLFNNLTGSNQYVGNWPGVTVEKKEGKLKGDKDVIIQDLPGIYSLSPYTLEEVVSRTYLVKEKPDAILNIIDGTNIERNLYLTTQLIELGIPVVMAVNMIDLVRKNGDKIDLKKLSAELGCQAVEISALKGEGTEAAAKAAVAAMNNGDVVLLQNTRFRKEETKNMPEFSEELASLADAYVDDAFGSCHRAHCSTAGVTDFIKDTAVGYLMEKEIKYLGNAVNDPVRPFTAILGGAKVADKLNVISNLLEKVDTLIIGGGMAYTFLKAQGKEVGTSLVDEEKIEYCQNMLKKAEEKGVKLLLPVDAACIKDFPDPIDAPVETTVVPVTAIPADMEGCDIGPETMKLFADAVKASKTVVWNGPMGVFENPTLEAGTLAVAKAMAESDATTVIGGGDSAAAVQQMGLGDKMTHISTGGGASLEYLEGKELPGIAVIQNA